jgi:hypothetical protein
MAKSFSVMGRCYLANMIMRKGLGTTTTTTTIATAAAIIIASAMLVMTTTVVYAQTTPENMTATTTTAPNATTTTAPINLEFEDEPFAESRIRQVSENVINETQQVEVVFEGNTTITTLPNTTETITTRDIGEGILTFIPGGGVFHGQLQMTTEDGSESAIALFTEHFKEESTTAISLVQFITNSTTGVLAPLNNMIAVTLDQEQPDGSIIIRYFEWEEESDDEDDEDDDDDDDDGETEEEEGEEGEEE